MVKTYNEKSNETVQFPVRYGLKGGVWPAYEAMMISQAWNLYKKSGAWFKIDEEFANELKQNNIEFQEAFQGERNMREYFDSHKDLVDYLLNKFRQLIT